MKIILLGLLFAIVEWFVWANMLGWLIYLLKSLEKLEFIDMPYGTILIIGTIFFILSEFVLLKTKEIKKFLDKEIDK